MVCASRAMDDCTATLPVVIYLRTFVLSLASCWRGWRWMVDGGGGQNKHKAGFTQLIIVQFGGSFSSTALLAKSLAELLLLLLPAMPPALGWRGRWVGWFAFEFPWTMAAAKPTNEWTLERVGLCCCCCCCLGCDWQTPTYSEQCQVTHHHHPRPQLLILWVRNATAINLYSKSLFRLRFSHFSLQDVNSIAEYLYRQSQTSSQAVVPRAVSELSDFIKW